MRLIRPLNDHILVKQDAPKEKTVSGLILPQGKETYEDIGTIIRTGPGVNGIELSVKVGDRVLFKRRPGSHLGESNPDWKDLLMLKEEDVVAILEDEETSPETAEPNTGFGPGFVATGDIT